MPSLASSLTKVGEQWLYSNAALIMAFAKFWKLMPFSGFAFSLVMIVASFKFKHHYFKNLTFFFQIEQKWYFRHLKTPLKIKVYKPLICSSSLALQNNTSGKYLYSYGGTAPPIPKSSKISMLCVLSQNYQHFFENWYIHLIVNWPRNSKLASKLQ